LEVGTTGAVMDRAANSHVAGEPFQKTTPHKNGDRQRAKGKSKRNQPADLSNAIQRKSLDFTGFFGCLVVTWWSQKLYVICDFLQ